MTVSFGRHTDMHVGALLDATGASAEERRFGTDLDGPNEHVLYEGQPFWGSDRFVAIRARPKSSTLISGGGGMVPCKTTSAS